MFGGSINTRIGLVMRKGDWIFIGIAGLFSLLLFCWLSFFQKDGSRVIVQIGDEVYGEYDLQENRQILLDCGNEILIQNGKVTMTKAVCPDQICVKHKAISHSGESIICLPNQVIVTVTGTKEAEVDGISG